MIKQPDMHIATDGPAELLAEEFHDVSAPPPETPRTVFPSDMVLTREQEDRLVQRARQRYDQLCQELGRDATGVGDDGRPIFLTMSREDRATASRTFMAKRLLYQCIMENDWSWRPLAMPESIFATSNLSVPLCRRISRQMAARANNYFFGTEPYFSVYPIGGSDKDLADALQTYCGQKLHTGGSHSNLKTGNRKAFSLGESVFKITYQDNRSFFRKGMTVAVDGEGKALTAKDGMPIEQTDLWVPAVPAATQDPSVPAPAPPPNAPLVLKRDMQTPHPGELNFQTITTEQEIIHYRGPRIDTIYFRDFLCPLNAPTIQDADTCVHIRDLSASQLAAAYMQSPGESLEAMQAAIEAIRVAVTGPREGLSASMQRPELGETKPPETMDATMLIGEFYQHFDADEDGYQEDCMLVMDLNSNTPIYYNYTPNVTDDGLRPFRCARAFEVENRWYGQGAVELFEEHQKAIDLMVNRRNRNQSEAGRITAWRPQNTLEGEANPQLKFNWGRTYTLKDGKTMEETFGVFYMDDNKFEKLTEEIQFYLQLAMNESGVTSANDNFVAGMDSAKLATGIRNVEKTGQELFGEPISNLETGIESAIDAFVTTATANMDEEEAFTLFEGDVPKELVLAKRDVQGLRFNVEVLLTRMRDEQVMQSSAQAEALVTKYYSLVPPLQALLQRFYIDMLKALQIPNAKQYIIPQAFSIAAPPPSGSSVPVPESNGVAPPPPESNVPPPNL